MLITLSLQLKEPRPVLQHAKSWVVPNARKIEHMVFIDTSSVFLCQDLSQLKQSRVLWGGGEHGGVGAKQQQGELGGLPGLGPAVSKMSRKLI